MMNNTTLCTSHRMFRWLACLGILLGCYQYGTAQNTLSIDDVSVAEGGVLVFTVSSVKTGPLPTPGVFNFTVVPSGSTETENSDIDFAGIVSNNPVDNSTFAVTGVVNQSIQIQVPSIQDAIFENAEQFQVFIQDNPAAPLTTIIDNTGIGTIINDDDLEFCFGLSETAVDEGESITITPTLSTTVDSPNDIATQATVLLGGTATEGADFDNGGIVTLTLTVPEGAITGTPVVINTLTDALGEGNETIEFDIIGASADVGGSTGGGVFSGCAAQSVTIQNVAAPVVSINSVSALEGDDLMFTVTTTQPFAADQDINFFFNPTALPTSAEQDDITPPLGGIFTFPAGQTTTTFTVGTEEDNVVEADEQFEVILSNPGTGAPFTIGGGPGVGTIINDDQTNICAIPALNVAAEGGGPATFTLLADNPIEGVTVFVDAVLFPTSTADLMDVDPTSLAAFLNGGETSRNFDVPIVDDNVAEGTETITIQLTGIANETSLTAVGIDPGDVNVGTGCIGGGTGTPTLSITDNDVVSFTIEANGGGTLAQDEGSGGGSSVFDFQVTANGAAKCSYTLTYAVNPSGDTEFNDLLTAPLTEELTFSGADGEIQFFTVQVTADDIVEADEDFIITLESVTPNSSPQCTIEPANFDLTDTETATILNDDQTNICVEIIDDTVTEGGVASYNLVATNPIEGVDVEINATLNPGSTGSILDVMPGPLVADLPAGTTAFNYTVPTVDDDLVEGDEFIGITLTGVANPGNLTAAGIDLADVTVGGNNCPAGATNMPMLNIIDNDVNTLTIDNEGIIIFEGSDGGSTDFTFGVTASNATVCNYIVNYAITPDPGTEVSDFFGSLTGNLLFQGVAGETGFITVSVFADDIVEPDESFMVELTSVSPAGGCPLTDMDFDISDTSSAFIENDDETSICVQMVTATVEEGEAGSYNLVATNPVEGVNVEITAALNVGTTASAADFPALPFFGALLPAGDVTENYMVPTTDDDITEGTEMVSITLTGIDNLNEIIAAGIEPSNIMVGANCPPGSTATPMLTITDNDVNVFDVSADAPSIIEGDAGTTTAYTFTITSPNATTCAFDLDFAIEFDFGNPLIAEPSDISMFPSQVSFAGTAGETQTVTVEIMGDNTVEADEVFDLVITDVIPAAGCTATAADFDISGRATGVIVNDDQTNICVEEVVNVVTEGGTASFNLVATNPVEGIAISVDGMLDASTTATAADFDLNSFMASLPAGTVFFNYTVPTVDDNDTEGTETVTLNLNGVMNAADLIAAGIDPADVTVGSGCPAGTTGSPMLTILDNDINVITITPLGDFIEGDGGSINNAIFAVTSPNNTACAFDIDYEVSFAPDTEAADFGAMLTGTLSFDGTGGNTQFIEVPIVADDIVELDEDFTVTLTNVTPAAGCTATAADFDISTPATGTIVNDDQGVLNIDDVSIVEDTDANGNLVFTVTLSSDVDVPFTVDFSTVLDGNASADDLVGVSGTLLFAGFAGETQTITVPILGDCPVEDDESFSVVLSNVQAQGRDVIIGDGIGTGTIINDDIAPKIVCYPDINANTEPGECGRFLPLLNPKVVESSCEIVSITNSRNGDFYFEVGTTEVTFTVTDAGGNVSTCSINVTVHDDTAPTIQGGAPSVVLNLDASAGCTATYTFNGNIADDCGNGGLTISGGTVTYFAPGNYTQTVSAIDQSGNVTSVDIAVLVVDPLATVLTNLTNEVFTLPSDGCQTIFNLSDLGLQSAVSCSGASDIFADMADGTVLVPGLYEITVSVGTYPIYDNYKIMVESTGPGMSGFTSCPSYFQGYFSPDGNPVDLSAVLDLPTWVEGPCGLTVTNNLPAGMIFPVGTTYVEYTATVPGTSLSQTCAFLVAVGTAQQTGPIAEHVDEDILTVFEPNGPKVIDWDVVREHDAHELGWSVVNPDLVEYYDLQYSTNGVDFVSLNTLEGADENGNRTARYGDQHRPQETGSHYYRVFVQPFDGRPFYTEAIRIELESALDFPSVYPNPADEFTYLNLSRFEGKQVTVRVYDNLGKLRHQERVNTTTNHVHRLDLRKYTDGMYHLNVDVEGRRPITLNFVVGRTDWRQIRN